MSAWVCHEPGRACWTVLGAGTWGLPGVRRGSPKRTCCHLLHVVSSAPQPPFPNFAINSCCMSLISACHLCVIIACLGIAWIHHRKDSPRWTVGSGSFFWQGQWPIALREGWCLHCYFLFSYFNTSISIFTVTVHGCTHTSSIVFIQILSSHTRL